MAEPWNWFKEFLRGYETTLYWIMDRFQEGYKLST
jgi:hypothetical protein